MEHVIPLEVVAERLDNSELGPASAAAKVFRAVGSPVVLRLTRRAELLPVYRRRLARTKRGDGPGTEGLEDFVTFLEGPGEVWLATAKVDGRAVVVLLDDDFEVQAVTAAIR